MPSTASPEPQVRRSRLRDLSRSLVINELRQSGPQTQAQLVRSSGLSRATVASIVSELRDEERVTEHKAERGTGRGRPGTLVSLAPSANTVIGVDFGHQHLAVALASFDGTVLAERHESMDVHRDAPHSLDAAARLIADILAEADINEQPAMVGVGVPGPIEHDPAAPEDPPRRVCAGTVLPAWAGLDPAQEITDRTGLPAIAENDANVGALGESRYGIGHGVENLIFVKVSSGIGTGMILNGQLYRGARGASGEIGHVQVREDGALCRCGSRGCLETVSSTDAALALLSPAHGRTMHSADLYALEEAGDPGALRLFSDMGAAVGKVLAVVAANIDPDLILFGGAMARKPLIDSVEATIHRHIQPYVGASIVIKQASLGERASLLGAIALAADRATSAALR